jgi:hypothetical protein
LFLPGIAKKKKENNNNNNKQGSKNGVLTHPWYCAMLVTGYLLALWKTTQL